MAKRETQNPDHGNGRKTILFVPLYESHLRVFTPLIKQLQEQGEFEPLVVYLERIHSEGLHKRITELNLPGIKVDLFPSSFQSGSNITIQQLNIRFMERKFRTLFYTRNRIKKLFDTLNPHFVFVVNESYYAERFFLHEAARRGIPSISLFSVMVQNPDNLSPTKPVSRKFPLKAILALPYRLVTAGLLSIYRKVMIAAGLPLYYLGAPTLGKVSRVCVWSESVKQQMLREGSIAEKIAVTGWTALDLIYHKDTYFGQETGEKIHKLIEIPFRQKIILFATQPFAQDGYCTPEQQQQLTELIVRTCAGMPDITLVIKLHPRESLEDYAYLRQSPSPGTFRLITDKDGDLWDMIYASRVVITQSSTAGLEAIFFDKDVVNVAIIIKTKPDYVKSGATVDVKLPEELAPALQHISSDAATQANLKEARNKYIKEHFPTFDGKATDRVMTLMKQILTKGQ